MSATTTVQNFLKAWENRDVKTNEKLLSDDFTLTGPAPVPLDKQAFLVFQSVHNHAFGDWSFNAREFHENGDTVTCIFHITAKQSGPYDVARLGIPIPPVPVSGLVPEWADEYVTATVKDGQITAMSI